MFSRPAGQHGPSPLAGPETALLPREARGKAVCRAVAWGLGPLSPLLSRQRPPARVCVLGGDQWATQPFATCRVTWAAKPIAPGENWVPPLAPSAVSSTALCEQGVSAARSCWWQRVCLCSAGLVRFGNNIPCFSHRDPVAKRLHRLALIVCLSQNGPHHT